MAEVIDSITVRYDADITPYLRGLKRLESETEKSLSKLERQYGAQLDQISRRGAEVLSQISALAGTPLQIAVAQERASATSRRHPRGRRPRAPELTPESIRREHDEHRTPAQLAIDLIEFVEEIPRKLIEVFTFALKRLLVPLEGVDLRDFDLDIRLKELEILGKRIEENRKQLSVAEGMEVEKAARELLDNLRVFRSILSRAIVEFGARQGQLGKAADVDAPTTPTGAAKIAELIRLQNAILEFVETIGDPNLTKAVRDAIDAIGIGRGARGPGRPLPSRRTSDAPEVESRPSVSVPGRVPELLPPPPKPDRVPELLPPRPKPVPPILPPRPKPNREDGIDAGVPISRGGERDGGFIQPAAFRFEDSAVDGAEVDLAAIDRQAAAWQGVLDRLDKVPPALARTRRETLDVDRAVRDLGFTFASAFEDAIVSGASLSDILQGLERDILRILTRLLVTEPLARGLTAGLGSFTGGGLGSGGGLEGVIGGTFGALANLFPSPVAGLGLGSFNALDALAAQDVANPLLAGIFQAGGPVHGPGGPTGDRIPAFLSDGEFVVNAEATRRNRQILEAINSNRLRRHVEEGGQIGMTVPEIPPIRRGPAPVNEPSFAGRPVVININNPTSVPEIQRGMAQIRGSLREMLARAERRGE